MYITHTWKITSVKRKTVNGVPDVVYQVYWEKIGTTDDGVEGRFAGVTPFDVKKINLENITRYDDLTQAQVIDWIKNVVVGYYEEHVNERILDQIEINMNTIIEDEWNGDEKKPIEDTLLEQEKKKEKKKKGLIKSSPNHQKKKKHQHNQ
jgi:hypothetical protein